MLKLQKYSDFKHGVINAIEPSDIPSTALVQSQNMYYRENRWRKMPGLETITPTDIGTDPVWGIGRHYNVVDGKKILLAASGSDVYRYDEASRAFTSIRSSMLKNQQVEFLYYPPFTYFGDTENLWQRYDGGTKCYTVGGQRGESPDAPRKFSQIIFSPYSGRFFGIGQKQNPDYLYWSEHISYEGIEKWPDGNVQIVESVNGDTPKAIDIFEGRIQIFSDNSISSGNVSGVPESWSFQRDRAQAGCYARRSLKKYGQTFLMLTPEFEVYQWPTDKFVSKGRVKFDINPYKAHLACAEIVDNRYYDICFLSGQQVSSNEYHYWRYDILGDRWYGPHIQRNIVSMFYDKGENLLYCGGSADLVGKVMQLRGRNVDANAMQCHLKTGFDFQNDIRDDKRYSMFRIKAKQEGNLPGGSGSLEIILNFDQKADQYYTQRILLEDPGNLSPNDDDRLILTSQVKDSIIARGHIHEQYGRASSIQTEFKHEVKNGDFNISEWEIEFRQKTKKEARQI